MSENSTIPFPKDQTPLFLQEETKLLIAIKPSGNYDKDLLNKYKIDPIEIKLKGDDIKKLHRRILIPIEIAKSQILHDQLFPSNNEGNHQKILFSISINDRLQKELTSCIYTSPVSPTETFKSLNSAYQAISSLFEKDRRAKGGRVYNAVYFEDGDGEWKQLEILRDRIYDEYKAPYEKYLLHKGQGVGSYLQLHPDSSLYLEELLKDKNNRIHDLLTQKSDLQEQLNYFNNLFQSLKINAYRKKLEEFEERLKDDHYETKGENSWQRWVFDNKWLLGTQYGEILEKEKIGFDKIPDFLLLTADGYLDVLEIKRPSLQVLREDSSHGNYQWSVETSSSTSQALNYLQEINRNHLEISKRIRDRHNLEINAIKPRGIVLIGKSDNWNNHKREQFRLLNQSMSGIEVVTYTDLLRRGKNIIKMYSE